jgi:preprotein translocase subunit SecD
MKQRRATTYLGGLVLVTIVVFALVVGVAGHRPFLGLDLQGGVSVVLRAKAPDTAEAVAAVADALTAQGPDLGLGEVTVETEGEQVVVTPTDPDKTDDEFDAAVDNARAGLEGVAAADVDVSRKGDTLVAAVSGGAVPDDSIDQAIEIIRTRVDALGVAEPEITRQGKNVVVQIPGIDDPDRALELVGQTAELRFRPVLNRMAVADIEAALADPPTTTTTAPGDSTTTTLAGDGSTTTLAGDGSTTTLAGDGSTTTTAGAAGDETGAAPLGGTGAGTSFGRSSLSLPVPVQDIGPSTTAGDTTTTVPTDSTDSTDTTATTVDPTATTLDPTATTLPAEPIDPLGGLSEVTDPDDDLPDSVVVLDDRDGELRYQLGPTLLTGSALSGATARIDPNSGIWYVEVSFKGGRTGIDLFNAAVAKCNPPDPTVCPGLGLSEAGQPVGLLGIVLDHDVVSAPQIESSNYGNTVTINGGQDGFKEGEAKDLALVLRYGALPVELEAQNVVRVSATLGSEALDAAILSGVVALVLVLLYMVGFYRLLGLLAVLKLVIEGALLYSFVSFLSETQGLALTLAGITGIIVSIGVSLDSNVVYYEHLKEDVLAGRTLRATVDRSFTGAFSTIFKADVASLIGAGLLWWFTVGPVRGFAFYLGISTLLDLVCSYFYMHPVVALATRSRLAQRRPQLFGLPGVPIVAATGEGSGPAAGTGGERGGGPVGLSKPEVAR